MAKTSQKKDEGIAEIKQYTDKRGRQLKVFAPIDGSPKLLIGATEMNLDEQRKVRLEFGFPAGTSIVDAYVMFDQSADKAKCAFIKEQEKSRSQLLGPDGRPAKKGKKDIVSAVPIPGNRG